MNKGTATNIELIKFQKIKFHFHTEKDININAWPGAALRNKFLYACSLVDSGNGKSLFRLFKECPLDNSHPLFNRFSRGFPKPFLIDCRNISSNQSGKSFKIDAYQPYDITLVLLGSHTALTERYVKAANLFMKRGLENNNNPLLLDSMETGNEENTQILHQEERKSTREIEININTPLSIIQTIKEKKYTLHSYQDKMNGFPSFYQIIRSLLYRAVTLDMLYGKKDLLNQNQLDRIVESEAADATRAVLYDADIKNYNIISTKKQHARHVYKMDGYVGNMTFGNVNSKYISLLKWGENIGVGNDISFGLGLYTSKEKKT